MKHEAYYSTDFNDITPLSAGVYRNRLVSQSGLTDTQVKSCATLLNISIIN